MLRELPPSRFSAIVAILPTFNRIQNIIAEHITLQHRPVRVPAVIAEHDPLDILRHYLVGGGRCQLVTRVHPDKFGPCAFIVF